MLSFKLLPIAFISGFSLGIASIYSMRKMFSLTRKHSGALNYLEEDLFLFGFYPLEASSSGLSLEGTRLH